MALCPVGVSARVILRPAAYGIPGVVITLAFLLLFCNVTLCCTTARVGVQGMPSSGLAIRYFHYHVFFLTLASFYLSNYLQFPYLFFLLRLIYSFIHLHSIHLFIHKRLIHLLILFLYSFLYVLCVYLLIYILSFYSVIYVIYLFIYILFLYSSLYIVFIYLLVPLNSSSLF